LKHQNVTFECLDESKVDVFSINGFNAAIATSNGAQKTAQRIGMAAQLKNFQNALVIDKEDSYEQKTMNFGGLAEILNQIRIGLACDLRMPMTKLFGISPGGMNSSGEEEIENYNSMIETEIRSKVKGGLILMLKILCKKMFDYIPDNLTIEWHPLREQSAQEQSLVKTDELNRIITAFSNGFVTSDQAIDILNSNNIFDSKIDASKAMNLEDLANLGLETVDAKSTSRTRL
jgi:phage-related protein (TIGR01555 family)